jgi:hypothetical protein
LEARNEWDDPAEVPVSKVPPAERKRTLSEELFAMLEGQAPPRAPAEAEVPFPDVDDEARSLEVLEPTESRSSARARERQLEVEPLETAHAVDEKPVDRPYAIHDLREDRPYRVEDSKTPQPYEISQIGRRKRYLTKSELRHAFVMREVLGPPKALEE